MANTMTLSPFSGVAGMLARSWWLLLLRGIAGVLFGLAAFAWPGLTLVTLVLVFGLYALADGVVAVLAALLGGGIAGRWWLALAGVVSIAAGLFALFQPGLSGFSILVFIGAWSVVRGITDVVGAIALRREITNEWSLGLSGVLSVLFGLAILAAPLVGAVVLIWMVGAWALVAGLLCIVWSMRLRRLRRAV